MLMHHAMQAASQDGAITFWENNGKFTTETFKPLSKRMGQNFMNGIRNLKGILLASDFENYIESIISLKIINGTLWLVTDRELHRSLLEHRFVPAFKEAFEVETVRIISQA